MGTRWVRHAKFGEGMVAEEIASPGGLKLRVVFPDGSNRVLLASFLLPIEAPASTSGVLFTMRSPRCGPLGKQVIDLHAASVTEWFASAFEATATLAGQPGAPIEDWLVGRLGAPARGLARAFERAAEARLPAPTTPALLAERLRDQLEPAEVESVRADGSSLRLRLSSDGGPLVCCFFDRRRAAEHPDRTRFLLWTAPRFPPAAADDGSAFTPGPGTHLAPLRSAAAGPVTGQGRVFICLLGTALERAPLVLSGLRFAELPAFLRESEPFASPLTATHHETWPLALRLLRAHLAPEDDDLSTALEAVSRSPLLELDDGRDWELGVGPHEEAREEVLEADGGLRHGRPRGLIDLGSHHALVCPALESGAHQQWILFDDCWAAANEALARSILDYTSSWDPFREVAAAASPP